MIADELWAWLRERSVTRFRLLADSSSIITLDAIGIWKQSQSIIKIKTIEEVASEVQALASELTVLPALENPGKPPGSKWPAYEQAATDVRLLYQAYNQKNSIVIADDRRILREAETWGIERFDSFMFLVLLRYKDLACPPGIGQQQFEQALSLLRTRNAEQAELCLLRNRVLFQLRHETG